MSDTRNVLDWLRVMFRIPATDTIMPHLVQRDAIGRAKYGKPLEAHNGRNALQDLFEELLDAVMYAAQAYMESGSPEHLAILGECITLAEKIQRAQ